MKSLRERSHLLSIRTTSGISVDLYPLDSDPMGEFGGLMLLPRRRIQLSVGVPMLALCAVMFGDKHPPRCSALRSNR